MTNTRASAVLASLFFAAVSAVHTRPLARVANRCRESEPRAVCGAGKLPRITDRDWSPADVKKFRERATQGTVAVAHADGKTTLLPGCRLPGAYVEVQGKPGSGRLWANNRVLWVLNELGPGCSEATHAIVVFVVVEGKTKPGAPAFSSILTPLPCPSINDPAPAKGCIGRGATGAVRKERAKVQMSRFKVDVVWKADPAHVLDVYALAPDGYRSLEYVTKINSECGAQEHARWVAGRYDQGLDSQGNQLRIPKSWPDPDEDERVRLDERSSERSCLRQPVFLKCFAGVFEPSPGDYGCWEPAGKKARRP